MYHHFQHVLSKICIVHVAAFTVLGAIRAHGRQSLKQHTHTHTHTRMHNRVYDAHMVLTTFVPGLQGNKEHGHPLLHPVAAPQQHQGGKHGEGHEAGSWHPVMQLI